MSITRSLSLGLVVSSDGQPASTKTVSGLSFTAANDMLLQSQAFGVNPPAAPAPTTLLAVPGTVTPTATAGGTIAAGTAYYYKVTALNAVGETTGSAEATLTAAANNSAIALSWAAVTGATSYKVYRGTAPGAESVSFAAASNSFLDTGAAGTAATVPASNNTTLASPGTVTPTPSTTGGSLAAATYYYKVTALNAVGETAGSAEASAVTTGTTSSVALAWVAVPGATSYKVYRGTAAGAESVYYTTATNSFTDTGAASTAGTVPAGNTTQLAAPGTVTPAVQVGGALAAATYYYKVTALNAAGETTGSAEASQLTTGANSAIALAWAAIAGAISYKVYRGTAAGAESVYYAAATNSFNDTGAVSTAGTVPASNTTGAAGSVAAGVYYIKLTYVNAPTGETTGSAESVAITALASSTIAIPSPAAAAPATGYNVYITAAGGASGTETKQNATPIPVGTNYTQTAAIAAGAALPASNTTLNLALTIPQSPAQAFYLRNLNLSGASIAATWTPQGGTSAKVLDLVPQAAILFLEPVAGAGVGGITALSLAATGPAVFEAIISG